MGSPFSLSRAIVQRSNQVDAHRALCCLVLEDDVPLESASVNFGDVMRRTRVVEVHELDDLRGLNVVKICAGQETHPLYEAAERRRRSRMLG